jgi:hypothetical protein
MPRDFIIAIASGGICGMFAICMVEVMFHSPGLPCPAKAVAGTRTTAAAINPVAIFVNMPFPNLHFRGGV